MPVVAMQSTYYTISVVIHKYRRLYITIWRYKQVTVKTPYAPVTQFSCCWATPVMVRNYFCISLYCSILLFLSYSYNSIHCHFHTSVNQCNNKILKVFTSETYFIQKPKTQLILLSSMPAVLWTTTWKRAGHLDWFLSHNSKLPVQDMHWCICICATSFIFQQTPVTVVWCVDKLVK